VQVVRLQGCRQAMWLGVQCRDVWIACVLMQMGSASSSSPDGRPRCEPPSGCSGSDDSPLYTAMLTVCPRSVALFELPCCGHCKQVRPTFRGGEHSTREVANCSNRLKSNIGDVLACRRACMPVLYDV
jgi:hypothetical protein